MRPSIIDGPDRYTFLVCFLQRFIYLLLVPSFLVFTVRLNTGAYGA